MIVVSDTSPINYLILIELQDLLPKLFDRILIPEAVHRELHSTAAPDLILFTGDAINNPVEQNQWDRFFSEGEPVLSRVPMLTVIGNHENNDALYFSHMALPGDEDSYGVDVGPLMVA